MEYSWCAVVHRYGQIPTFVLASPRKAEVTGSNPVFSIYRNQWFMHSYMTLQGYGTMHMTQKGQLADIAKNDILAQNHAISQLFGLEA